LELDRPGALPNRLLELILIKESDVGNRLVTEI
jgi:hypothetical protein